MRIPNARRRQRAMALLGSAALMFQAGSCQFDDVTTTVTLSGRDVFVSLFRNAILGPIDAYVTGAIDNFFDEED